MNSFRKAPFVMNIDGSSGCIISEDFTIFSDRPGSKASSSTIDIVEITDTGCDARFPGQFNFGVMKDDDKNIFSFERIHNSRIPRLTKSFSKSKNPTKNEKVEINININRIPSKRSKLPVPISSEQIHPIKSPEKIEEKTELPLKNDNLIDCKVQKSETSQLTLGKKYQKAQSIGARIGQKISTLVEHVKKKQIEANARSDPRASISIVKKILRQDTEVEDLAPEGVCEANADTVTTTTTTGVGQDVSLSVMECGGCGERVRERTVLCVGGRTWHSRCLRCCACARPLHDQHSCFLRGMRLYCRHDYALTFGAKCAKCGRSVSAGDWVRRARERVYHLACFACDACSRQLSTGEQFALLDARLLCKAHYLDVVEGNNTSSDEGGDSESGHKSGNKAKRVRTTFTEEQLSVLQANFQLDSNPDGQDLERIAHVTGLSKRVTQVWFQNSRARQKKHLHTGKMKGQHTHQSPPNSTASPGDFGRHINLHLTYSFQHQQHHQQSQGHQTQLSPAACKSPTPSIYHSHGSEQSMDELSQDSMLLTMPNEV